VDFGCLTLEDSVDLIASHLRASVASTEGFHASYLRTSSVESYRRSIAWDSRGLSNAIDQPPAFHIACSPTTTFPYASIPIVPRPSSRLFCGGCRCDGIRPRRSALLVPVARPVAHSQIVAPHRSMASTSLRRAAGLYTCPVTRNQPESNPLDTANGVAD